MALVLDDAVAQKAATGPNPQNRGGNQAVGTPSASGNARGGAAPPTNRLVYDYSTDPILQQIVAQQNMVIAQAQQDALAQQKAALIGYGDPHLAMSVLGDKLTAEAAANNPGSTLATLTAKQQSDTRDLNEAENKANLFYSSDAGYKLGQLGQSYLQQQAQAAGAVGQQLGTIGTQLLAQKQAAFNQDTNAQLAAYGRAVKNPVGVPAPPAAKPVAGPQLRPPAGGFGFHAPK